MKFLKIWAAVALLLAGCAVSFCLGRNYESYYYNFDNLFEVHQQLKAEYQEVYDAACILSDAIRIEYDTVDDDEKCCTYTAYSALEEACCEYGIDTDSLLRQYVYCY